MKISIRGRNGAVTDQFRQYAEKKASKLDRYFRSIQNIEIEHAVERGQHIVELNLEGDGIFLRSEERNSDMLAAVDKVVGKLERQIKRYKERLKTEHQRRDGGKAAAAKAASAREEEPEDFVPHIARRKRFPMKPMSADEAASQMELVDHDFFLFLNEASGEVNVLYRRRDGHYGLIEPET